VSDQLRALWNSLTWDFIIQACEGHRIRLTPFIEEARAFIDSGIGQPFDSKESAERVLQYATRTIELHEALLAAVLRLRDIPDLYKLVPMMSMQTLRWWFGGEWLVWLSYEPDQKLYGVCMTKGGTTLNEKLVDLHDVAPTVWAYIQEVKRKDINDNASSAAERS
jgi:hypothetical protein